MSEAFVTLVKDESSSEDNLPQVTQASPMWWADANINPHRAETLIMLPKCPKIKRRKKRKTARSSAFNMRASQSNLPAKYLLIERARTNDSAPFPARNTMKMHDQPMSSKLSYPAVLNSHLQVAIINLLHPLGKITIEQATIVEGWLSDELDKTITSALIFTPAFEKWQHAGEILHVTCRNQESLDWLKEHIKATRILRQVANLSVVRADNLPKLTKISVWVPGHPAEPHIILQRLVAQNPTLSITYWCEFHRETKEDGVLLVLGAPPCDITEIKKTNGIIYYRFSTLKVKIHSGEENSGLADNGKATQGNANLLTFCNVPRCNCPPVRA